LQINNHAGLRQKLSDIILNGGKKIPWVENFAVIARTTAESLVEVRKRIRRRVKRRMRRMRRNQKSINSGFAVSSGSESRHMRRGTRVQGHKRGHTM
jgi:hypothetical protein